MSTEALVGMVIGCTQILLASAWAQWYLRRPR